jgi:hypothetical protein
MVRSCASASRSTWCALAGVSELPVGLCSTDTVTYRRGLCSRSSAAITARSGPSAPRGTGSRRMPRRVRRANSTAQPGSSTSTASPGCSKVRQTRSSAWVAPTVVTICPGVAATPRSARRCDKRAAQEGVAGRFAVAQPGVGAVADAAQSALQQRGVEPALRQCAHAGRGQAALGLEHAADQGRGVHRRRQRRPGPAHGGATPPQRRPRRARKKPRCGRACTRPRACSRS